MTIDFTGAKHGICLSCGNERLLGIANGKEACLWCHSAAAEAKDTEPRRVTRTTFRFTPNRNIGQARHSVGRNGTERRGKVGAL